VFASTATHATWAERDQELEEFYAHEEAERHQRFEAWRQRRRGNRSTCGLSAP
jgi:hypothetical protein